MHVCQSISWQHVLASLVVYLGSLAFYRLFLDPLAKFPGPKLAALTRWYEGYYDVIRNGQYTFKIAELHKTYGPIVRISPYELHMNDPAFYHELYRQDGRWDKYAWANDPFGAPGSTICSVSHDAHKHRRAPLNSFVSKPSVVRREDLIHRLCEKLCARISEFSGTGTPNNIGAAISAFTRDVGTEFFLNVNHDHIGKEDFNEGLTNVIKSSGAIWRITKHVRWFAPAMKSLPVALVEKIADSGTKAFFDFLKSIETLTKATMDAVAAGEDRPQEERNIIHQILDSKLPDAEKTLARMADEASTITGASFETSANTLRTIFFHVYDNSNVLSRLREELAATDTGSATWSTLERLPYLTGVLMEGLRLAPGVATRLARIAPDRDLHYDGWTIPSGTPVGMTTLLMHHDETLYPEPKSFVPDRWMDTEARRRSEKTFAPFSRGTRNCLGMHLAWAEMYILVAAVVRRFDLRFDGLTDKDFECVSDQFAVGTADEKLIQAIVTELMF